MNPLIQFKNATRRWFTALALLCFGLLPMARAVNPAPDGCYPNFTTAEGCDALRMLITGVANTGLGWRSLFSNSSGSFNTGVGAGALVLNNADSNTALGAAALLLNTAGTGNTAIGTAALLHNDSADQNTATGAFALSNHVSGNLNTAIGANTLFSDSTGELNTAVGASALFTANSGMSSSFNTAVGASALQNSTGGDNNAVGAQALQSNTAGNDNIAIGVSSLGKNTTGSQNIAIGTFAGIQQTDGSNNIYIGYNLQGTAGESDACYIESIFGQNSSGGTAVFVNSDGRLGTATSSRRFKEEIRPMQQASEALFALKPVTFHYKKEIDPMRTSQFGLVAEDVENVNPDLVVRDKGGRPYSVRYDQVNAMLLNEFLKAHRRMADQDKRIEELTTQLKEQAAQIQKVSAQLAAANGAAEMRGDIDRSSREADMSGSE